MFRHLFACFFVCLFVCLFIALFRHLFVCLGVLIGWMFVCVCFWHYYRTLDEPPYTTVTIIVYLHHMYHCDSTAFTGDLSTEEYEKYCTEAMFRIQILEQRLAAHEEVSYTHTHSHTLVIHTRHIYTHTNTHTHTLSPLPPISFILDSYSFPPTHFRYLWHMHMKWHNTHSK